MNSRFIFASRWPKLSRDGRWFNRSFRNGVSETHDADQQGHNHTLRSRTLNTNQHTTKGAACLSAAVPKLLIVPFLAVGVLATTAAFGPTDTDVPLLQVETASADPQEMCFDVPSTHTETEWVATGYGGGGSSGYWRTYTITEYTQHCYPNIHRHLVDTIVQTTAISVVCGGVGFLAGGLD